MGFWGTYVVLRSAEPPEQVLPAITALQAAVSRDGSWSAGWRMWIVRDSAGSLPDDLLEQLHATTGVPVLLGRVLDSDAVHVVATGTSVRLWKAWLQLDRAMGFLLDPPYPFDDDDNYLGDDWRDPAYEAKAELTRREILAQAPGGMAGARSAQSWARDAGLVPDRYGPVAAILFADPGFISVRLRTDGDYIVTVWVDVGLINLVASGQTSSLEDIVTTMRDWQDRRPVRNLLDASPYLEAADSQTVAETLWRLLVDHGEPYLRPIVTAAARNPTLRSLRPWISHGTLHLLHADDAVTGARLGLAFHPAGDARYAVNIYDGPLTPTEDAASAVARAAAAAAAW